MHRQCACRTASPVHAARDELIVSCCQFMLAAAGAGCRPLRHAAARRLPRVQALKWKAEELKLHKAAADKRGQADVASKRYYAALRSVEGRARQMAVLESEVLGVELDTAHDRLLKLQSARRLLPRAEHA